MKRMKHSFTLIEMLVVMSIAALLIALLIPGFNKMMFGSKVDQCTSNLKLGFELAQSRAVSARKYVALIFPVKYSETDSRLKKYVGGGYRMAYVKKDGSSWKFLSWIPDDFWRNPAEGAMLVKIVEGKSDIANADAGSLETSVNNGFKGAATHLTKLTSVPTDDEDLSGIKADTLETALIFSPYGGLADRNLPLGFVVTEAKVSGDGFVYDNPDNYLVLKVNAITGRVENVPMKD